MRQKWRCRCGEVHTSKPLIRCIKCPYCGRWLHTVDDVFSHHLECIPKRE